MGSAYTVRLIVCTNDETVVDDLYREAWQSDTGDYLRSAVTAAGDAARAKVAGTGLEVVIRTDSFFQNWHGGVFSGAGVVAVDVIEGDGRVLLDGQGPANVRAVAKKVADAAAAAFTTDLEESYRATLLDEIRHLANHTDEMGEWSEAARERVRWWIEEANGPRGTYLTKEEAAKVAAALAAIK